MATTQNIHPVAEPEEHAPVLDATHARQGRRGLHVLWILVISMALVVVVFGIIWGVHAPSMSRASSQGLTDGRAFNAPLPQPLPSDAGQPAAQPPRQSPPS